MSPLAHRMGRPGMLGAGLILLALWVQALAPVAALRMALGPVDPLAGAIICGHASGDDGAAVEQPAPPPQPCDLCRLCRAGIAPPPCPAAPLVARSLRWIALAWPIPLPARPGLAPRPTGRPRDPPAFA